MKKCDRLEIDSRPRRIPHFPFFFQFTRRKNTRAVRITSWYPEVSGSHFGLPPMLGPQNDWTEWQKGVNDNVCALATVTNKKSQKNPGLQSIEGVASRKVTDLEA